MNESIVPVLKSFGINESDLSPLDHYFLKCLDEKGLLLGKMLSVNEGLYHAISALIKEHSPYKFFLSIAMAIPEEFNIGACIVLEWFSTWGDSNSQLLKDGEVDLVEVRKRWDKYKEHLGFLIYFNHSVKDFNSYRANPHDLATTYYQLLHKYCGVAEVEIENFYSDAFQEFLIFFARIVKCIKEENCIEVIHAINETYSCDLAIEIDNTSEEFDTIVLMNDDCFKAMVDSILSHFSRQRKCTISAINSHVDVVPLNNTGKLKGDSDISILGFDEFNNMLKDLLDGGIDIGQDNRQSIEKYLDHVTEEIQGKGGFINIIKRQQALLKRYNNRDSEKPKIEDVSDEILQVKTQHYSDELNDLAALHRLKSVLEELPSLGEEERVLVIDKLTSIIKSDSANFYSDIFELYFLFLLKKSGVNISALKSQKKDGNEVSTCDYSFNGIIAADCKCLISNNLDFKNISEWCQKIGAQVKSTINYQGIRLGGGVIALKDQSFDFLKPFRDFAKEDSEKTRANLMAFAIEAYSEFRRHTISNAEQIKFLVIYYLPTIKLTTGDIRNAQKETVTNDKEMLLLMSTEFATDEDVSLIQKAFEPVCQMLFKFNNMFA